MRSAAVLVTFLALGGAAATVAAARPSQVPVPVPTVTVPTVPTITVPSVTTPSVTPPTPAPAPVQVPAVTTPGVQTPSAGGSSSSNSGSSSAGTSDASSSPPAPRRLRSSRSWIAAHGSDKRRKTTLRFALDADAVVEFTVVQVSPVCRFVGRFRVAGHVGANAIPFNGKIGGRQLPAGTYRIIAKTRGGKAVARLTLVIVDARAPTKDEVAVARRSNVCSAGGELAAAATQTDSGSATGSTENASSGTKGRSTIVRNQNESGASTDSGDGAASPADGGTHPVASGPTASVSEAATNPFVIAFLGIAVLLLGLAALPRTALPDPRTTALIAAHRGELALAGAAALAVAVVGLFVV